MSSDMVQVCQACGVRRSAAVPTCHVCRSRRSRLETEAAVGGIVGGHEALVVGDGPGSPDHVLPRLADATVTTGGVVDGEVLTLGGPYSPPSPLGPVPGNADAGPLDEGLFDPGAHSVAEVGAYMDAVDEDEQSRVLEAERAGRARKGIIG